MFNIISVNYLLRLVIFIYIISICSAIEKQIKIAFMNGLNVIRCSENQVQVYELKDIMGKVISTIVECDRRNEIYYNKYIGLEWNALKLICSSDNDKVREEQTITRVIPGDIDFISDVKGQLDQSTDSYELEFEDTLSNNVKTMVSSEQLADSTYFKADRSPKQRTIYVWFPNHPIICRLRFLSDEDNPCPSLHEKSVDANYACYYYPGATALPTKEQMEAELKQIEETDKPDDTEAYVLDLTIPVRSFFFSISKLRVEKIKNEYFLYNSIL